MKNKSYIKRKKVIKNHIDTKKQAKFLLAPVLFKGRLYFTVFLILILFLGVFSRAVYVQIIEQDKLKYENDLRTLRVEVKESPRGIIRDRNDEVLAVSVPVVSVWVDPKVIEKENSFYDKKKWNALSDILELDFEKILSRVKNNQNKRFLYLKRHVTNSIGDYIKKLDIAGVFLEKEARRYYPAGETVAQLIGLTDIDDVGIEGLEKSFDKWLRGEPITTKVRKNLNGDIVENISLIDIGEQAKDLTLTIDIRAQSIIYRILKKAMIYYQASAGSIVVIDVETGELIAMVNAPSYNPNFRSHINLYSLRNRAITDAYELGSVIKPFVILSALEGGVISEDTMIDTSPGYLKLDHGTVRDSKNYGQLLPEDILAYSSNVGISKIALKMPIDMMLKEYIQFGFGQFSGINLYNENIGSLPNKIHFSDIDIANLAFGYGLTVTPLQIAHAYAILGSKGEVKPLKLIQHEAYRRASYRIASDENVKKLLKMLEKPIKEGGTAQLAAVKGFRVAGKTGTARKLSGSEYSNSYVNIFAGLVPLPQPKFAVAVVIDEPKGDFYYGGSVSAPIFSEVMSNLLRLYNISPSITVN